MHRTKTKKQHPLKVQQRILNTYYPAIKRTLLTVQSNYPDLPETPLQYLLYNTKTSRKNPYQKSGNQRGYKKRPLPERQHTVRERVSLTYDSLAEVDSARYLGRFCIFYQVCNVGPRNGGVKKP